MNEALWDSEQKGGAQLVKPNMERLREMVDEVVLKDLCYSSNPFTWPNRWTINDPILKRLDQFLGNEKSFRCFSLIQICHLKWYSSDHRPITVELNVDHAKSHPKGWKRHFCTC